MLAFVTLAAIMLGVALIGYAIIAQDLPAPTELKALASDFQTTRIFDRNGNLLNETFDPNAGRRTAVSLGSPTCKARTRATKSLLNF